MAKELPYYKHEPSEWLEGEIQVCSDAAIVCFTNLRDGYWLKLGCISYAFALQKYCRRDATILQELIDNGIVDLQDDKIIIKFLDKQLNEFQNTSEKRRKAAQKRWNDASAMQMHSKSNAIREEKIKEEKIREDNTDTRFSFKKSLCEYGADEKLVSDWLNVRRLKKAANTETAFKGFINQVEKSDKDINEVLRICIERSWKGFDAKWLENDKDKPKETNGLDELSRLNDQIRNSGIYE